jgi:predicted nucleic acid-binding protein
LERAVTLFLDANIIIYLVEGTKALQERVARALGKHRTRNETVAVSRLSWLECRVRPLRERNGTVLTAYEDFFAARDLTIVDLTAAVVETAAQLRAALNLSTPDALQAACALQIEGPVCFFSNDRRLARVPGLAIEAI